MLEKLAEDIEKRTIEKLAALVEKLAEIPGLNRDMLQRVNEFISGARVGNPSSVKNLRTISQHLGSYLNRNNINVNTQPNHPFLNINNTLQKALRQGDSIIRSNQVINNYNLANKPIRPRPAVILGK